MPRSSDNFGSKFHRNFLEPVLRSRGLIPFSCSAVSFPTGVRLLGRLYTSTFLFLPFSCADQNNIQTTSSHFSCRYSTVLYDCTGEHGWIRGKKGYREHNPLQPPIPSFHGPSRFDLIDAKWHVLTGSSLAYGGTLEQGTVSISKLSLQ